MMIGPSSFVQGELPLKILSGARWMDLGKELLTVPHIPEH